MEAGQEKGLLSRCLGGRGSTFRTGQRLLAQDAEAEVLVEATGSGLFQHLWAPVYSVQLEEAPSLQLTLGGGAQSQFPPAISQLGPCTWGGQWAPQ